MDQKIKHFSHIHPLPLQEEHKNDDEVKEVSCLGCEKPISGPAFCCNQCNYVLHKSCTELPRKVKHPLHPQHPLTLLSTTLYSAGYICDLCRYIHNSSVYHCYHGKYDLDIACASSWQYPDDGHSHAFISLKNPQPFVCYACGKEDSEGLACLCTICQIWVHSGCAELPQAIRTNCHRHPLKLTYSLHHVYGLRDDITCGACNGLMSSSFGGYFCSTCKFAMHLKCPENQSEDLVIVTEDEDEEDETHVCDYEDSYIGSSETDQYDQSSLDIGFSSFSHEHLLSFMEELSLQCADELCDGCVQPVTPPLFSCSEICGFLLHKSCAESPRTKQHRFHPHPLTLLSKAPPYDGIYRCDGCKPLSNGFVYHCGECQFDLDVFCGTLVDTFKHESHRHPLSLERTSIARECKGCHLPSEQILVCGECDDFAIDCGCANLPSKAWHMYDKHPPSPMYFVKGDLREYNCGICKEQRSPKQWFYYCDECDFDAHPCCVLDKSRGIKFGGTFQYDAHSHPFALVEEIGKHSPCEACGEGANGWTLQCGRCKCYFHREGQCFWEQFKEIANYLALSGTMRHKYAANVLAATPNVANK